VSEDPGRNGGNWYWYANTDPVNNYDMTCESSEFIADIYQFFGNLLVLIGRLLLSNASMPNID